MGGVEVQGRHQVWYAVGRNGAVNGMGSRWGGAVEREGRRVGGAEVSRGTNEGNNN